MSSRLRVLIGLLVVAALAFVGWRTWRLQSGGTPLVGGSPDTTQAGVRAVTLWFADAGGDSLVSEVRELPETATLHDRADQLVDELVRGPAHGGVAVVPAGTSVLHVYLDDRGLLTLDLSRAFQQGFHGGSREEALVVGTLLRTIGANLPEAKRVLIACGGAPLASLGGHLPLDLPLDPHAEY